MPPDFLLFGAISLGVLVFATLLAGSFTVERGSRHPWRRVSLLRIRAASTSRHSGRCLRSRTHPGIKRYPDRRQD